jgi:hypothetical protein
LSHQFRDNLYTKELNFELLFPRTSQGNMSEINKDSMRYFKIDFNRSIPMYSKIYAKLRYKISLKTSNFEVISNFLSHLLNRKFSFRGSKELNLSMRNETKN